MNPGATTRRPSWARVALLVALGVTIGVAFTAPGEFVLRRCYKRLRSRQVALNPQWLMKGTPSRWAEAIRAFNGFKYEGEDTEREVPAPECVARRLEGIEGWTTAVLSETGAEPGELRDAGVEYPTCVLLVKPPYFTTPRRSKPDRSGPIRQWQLVLLDAEDREVGRAYLSALRPGFELSDVNGERVFVPSDGAPGDGELPAVCVFRRTETGEVLTG